MALSRKHSMVQQKLVCKSKGWAVIRNGQLERLKEHNHEANQPDPINDIIIEHLKRLEEDRLRFQH